MPQIEPVSSQAAEKQTWVAQADGSACATQVILYTDADRLAYLTLSNAMSSALATPLP